MKFHKNFRFLYLDIFLHFCKIWDQNIDWGTEDNILKKIFQSDFFLVNGDFFFGKHFDIYITKLTKFRNFANNRSKLAKLNILRRKNRILLICKVSRIFWKMAWFWQFLRFTVFSIYVTFNAELGDFMVNCTELKVFAEF